MCSTPPIGQTEPARVVWVVGHDGEGQMFLEKKARYSEALERQRALIERARLLLAEADERLFRAPVREREPDQDGAPVLTTSVVPPPRRQSSASS